METKKLLVLMVICLFLASPIAYAQDNVGDTTDSGGGGETTPVEVAPEPTPEPEPVTTEPVVEVPATEPEPVQEVPVVEEPTEPITTEPVEEPVVGMPEPEPVGGEPTSGGGGGGVVEEPVGGEVPTVEPVGPQQPIIHDIPDNCREVVDMNTGISNVICEKDEFRCPPKPLDAERQCKEGGGFADYEIDNNGCERFICRYQEAPASGFMGGQVQCPADFETKEVAENCKNMGMRPLMKRDMNGCSIVECIEENQPVMDGGRIEGERRCFCPVDQEIIDAKIQKTKAECLSGESPGNPIQMVDHECCNYIYCGKPGEMPPGDIMCPPWEEMERMKKDCFEKGGRVDPFIDEHGCEKPMCRMEGEPRWEEDGGMMCRPVPREAFDNCGMKGGELIVQKDDTGCPTYIKCVMRGDERSIEYEDITEVPDATVLLSMAFKLESLKMNFDQLALKTENIADYYASVGNDAEAERFRRVSGMFEGAKFRIDEIKNKMRDRLDTINTQDISEFKHDLKYINEVVIKDILYVMLSTEGAEMPAGTGIPEEAGREEEIIEEGFKNCGKDEWCFMESLRICEKAVFFAPGPSDMPSEPGPKIKITGMEGKNCVMHFFLERGPMGKSYEMTCKHSNFAMGMRGGPEAILPYCEGSMVEMMNTFGTGGGPQEPAMGPSEPAEMIEREPMMEREEMMEPIPVRTYSKPTASIIEKRAFEEE